MRPSVAKWGATYHGGEGKAERSFWSIEVISRERRRAGLEPAFPVRRGLQSHHAGALMAARMSVIFISVLPGCADRGPSGASAARPRGSKGFEGERAKRLMQACWAGVNVSDDYPDPLCCWRPN